MVNFDYILWPCSVEFYEDWNNLEQLIEEIKLKSPTLFQKIVDKKILLRWGCWKPRTVPGCFEWYWIDAVRLMWEIQKEYNILCITEVGSLHHLEICFQYGITNLWIGARTTSNPFLMDELAKGIRDYADEYNIKLSDISIGVKNPIGYDMELWKGALLRLKNAWVSLYPLHRGYNFSKKWLNEKDIDFYFRNKPYTLEELKVLESIGYKEDTIITDFSHIIGNREHIIFNLLENKDLLLKNKLMLEVHPNPKNALTDAKQQLSVDDIIHVFKKANYL